ncbi:MAG: prepilin-type N-terminal cleavage/methylation domain-containing protein [Desulfotignum sp.]
MHNNGLELSGERRKKASDGFTLIEILVALLITSILVTAIYRFFIGQHHAYTVQDQVIEMEQNARAAMDMIRRDLRMAGYHAMGNELLNHLSDFVPPSFIPAYPVNVNLDANPKISKGGGTGPDVITFLSVLPTGNNPTTLSTAVSEGSDQISVNLTATRTDNQYNIGDIIHIGTGSEYAAIKGISGNTLTIDTHPADDGGNRGVSQNYAAGTPIGEIYVVSYAVFNEDNDSSYDRHDPGHPVLKRKANGGGFQPVAENITDMRLRHVGSGEIEVVLSSRTHRPDHRFQTNDGYRTYTARAKINARNADAVAVGTDCAVPAAPDNPVLTGLDDIYPCNIHMTWDPVTGDTGCEISNYIIYYGTTARSYPNRVEAGNVTAYTLDVAGLTGCTYYVTVAAVNSAGTGPGSAEQSITDVLAPATPTGFTAENINGVERKVVLSWNKNSECDLLGYTLEGKSGAADGFVQINDRVISKEFDTFTDIDFDAPIDCATYYYRIQAQDCCPNASDSTTQVSVSPTAPAPPANPVFSTDGSTTDTLAWTLSTDDFDVLDHNDLNYITGYRVYGPDSELLDDTLAPGTNTWASTSLNAYYDVSAVDACGNESEKVRFSFEAGL